MQPTFAKTTNLGLVACHSPKQNQWQASGRHCKFKLHWLDSNENKSGSEYRQCSGSAGEKGCLAQLNVYDWVDALWKHSFWDQCTVSTANIQCEECNPHSSILQLICAQWQWQHTCVWPRADYSRGNWGNCPKPLSTQRTADTVCTAGLIRVGL